MNVLLQWCESERLEWDEATKTAYGMYDEYPFYAESRKKDYLLHLFCTGAPAEQFEALEYNGERLTVLVPHDNSSSLMYISAALNHLCKAARSASLAPANCLRCGKHDNLRVWPCGDTFSLFCINCREELSQIEKSLPVSEPSPTPHNIVGAAIGAFLAVIFYSIIYQVGNFTTIAGAAAALFICVGYGKGGGAFKKRALSFCSLLGVLTILVSQICALWITLYIGNFWRGVTLAGTLKLLPPFLLYPGVMRTATFEVLWAAVPMLLIILWWFLREKKR